MCFARTGTIINLCRQIVDAEHELCRLLRTHHVREDMEQVRADVAARGGAEALRFLERALSEAKVEVKAEASSGPEDLWRCPMCGDSYQFSSHPFCMRKALRERDRALAEAEVE